MINRSKLLRLSFGLTKSLFSAQHSHLRVTQVSLFSNFTHFNPTFIPVKPYICCNDPFKFQQNAFFSSKPRSFIDLVLSSDDWSKNIEVELDKMSPVLTHESVSYVLMCLITNPQKSFDFFNWVCEKKGFCPSFTPHFLLLRSLACKEFMVEFWNIFLEMKRKGFYLNEKVFSTISVKFSFEKMSKEKAEWTKRYKFMIENDGEKDFVNEVLELILSNDWGDEVKGELMKKLKFPLTENFLLRVIEAFLAQPLKGLKFFEWVGSCGGYKHDSVTYNALAGVLGQPSSVSEFWDIVKQMRSEGYDIDIYTYTKCTKNLPDKDAIELFELMMNGPYQPPLRHSKALLIKMSYELDPDLDLVYRVFNKIVGVGNESSKPLYDCVYRVLWNLGRFDEAKKILEDLRSSGYKPDNFTYSIEIFGLCKAGRFDEACKVIEQMEAEGCVPTAKTWTVLIRGHCEADRIDQALSLFEKMKEKNVNPIPETLSVLIKGFISANRVSDAYCFFNDLVMKEDKLNPHQDTCILMIEKLTEVGKVNEALDIVSTMKKHRYQLFPLPITKYISKCGIVDDAKKLLTVLSPSSSSSSSVKVYGKVIEAFIEQGRLTEAKDLFHASPVHIRQDLAILNLFPSEQAPPLQEVS